MINSIKSGKKFEVSYAWQAWSQLVNLLKLFGFFCTTIVFILFLVGGVFDVSLTMRFIVTMCRGVAMGCLFMKVKVFISFTMSVLCFNLRILIVRM